MFITCLLQGVCRIRATGCAGVPSRCSLCCAACGYGRAPGEEGAGCRCPSGKYWPTWECWSNPFILTPSQTQMLSLTQSLNQHFGLLSLSLEGLAGCVFVWASSLIFCSLVKSLLASSICVLAGVCMSCGHIDQLHRRYSLFGPVASDPEHLHPGMDCLAPVLWTLEPDHDCFPLLQGCQHITWIPPFSRENDTLHNCQTFQIISAWMKRFWKH